MSHKVSCVSLIIHPVINRLSPSALSSHLHIFYQSIINFFKRGFCLGFPHTSSVERLKIIQKLVVEKLHNYIYNLNVNNSSLEDKIN